MSVLIKGMQMPTTCGNCPVHKLWAEDDEAQCMIVRTLWTKYSERNPNCPLVPVPPHGRLIDADALMERFDKEMISCDEHGREFSFSFMRGSEYCAEWWVVEQFLWDAETVIPAEVTEEGS